MFPIDFLTPVNRSILFAASLIILWFVEFGIPLTTRRERKIIPNILLTIVTLIIYSLFGLLVISISSWTSSNAFGLFHWLEISKWAQLAFTILLLDFWSAYVAHVVMHKIDWLWQIHSVHHSDTMVDVTTSLRQHPGESVLRNSFLLISILLLGTQAWMVIFYQTISSSMALLEHANIRLKPRLDALLGLVFVTPNFHKVHHSKYQIDSDYNYGNIFSLWDRCFSTYRKKSSYDNIDYGLDYLKNSRDFSFRDLLTLPFNEKSKNHEMN